MSDQESKADLEFLKSRVAHWDAYLSAEVEAGRGGKEMAHYLVAMLANRDAEIERLRRLGRG